MSSFWSDATPITKGVIIVGGLFALYLAIAFFANLPPFMHVEQIQTRGLTPP